MKKVWKWVIGIILGLIVIAVLVGVGFLVWGDMHVVRGVSQLTPRYSQRGPGIMPYGGFGYGMRGPGMMGYGIFPFGGIFGGLMMLAFLVLVVLGIIWLVNRSRAPKPVAATPTAPAASPEPAAVTVLTPCKKCGRPLQAEWAVCPYCGKKV